MLILLYSVFILLMIFIPVALAAGLRRIWTAPWILFGVGCLTFLLSQVIHLPLNQWLADIGLLPGTVSPDPPIGQTAVVAGLTAGLCEELVRAAGFAVLRKLRAAWTEIPHAILLAFGHGGIESMITGGVITAATVSSLIPFLHADISKLGLPADQTEMLRLQLEQLSLYPWSGGYAVVERVLAISAHTVFSLMIWKAVSGGLGRNWFYLPLAVLYHAGVDAGAVWAMDAIDNQPWLIEALFAATLAPGWIWAGVQIRNWARKEPERLRAPRGGIRGEWAVFAAAVQKEFVQLWRTRRMLVAGAVFLVFGMGSPLIAKVIPDVFKSVAGMEQFAGLIPTPTAVDAMAQYIKNISQFGFVLALLLGMNTVSGEKERGVAPMILSKPMPRWAFLLAKFAAQAGVFLLCFGLAGAGAYYYTLVLFGPLEIGPYLLANALMWIWLLTFVALTLLGSVLGKSTVSAGGIGLALSVAVMLLSSIPRYGLLFPNALLGWAEQAANQAAGAAPLDPVAAALAGQMTANGAALGSAVIVIVVAFILSLGFFEQQEL